MKYFVTIIMMFTISCAGFKPKYLPPVATESLAIDFDITKDKPKGVSLYKHECDLIPADGVFYSTEEHDKIIVTIKKCIQYRTHNAYILTKYQKAIGHHNNTIKDYNKMVKVYYDEKSKKKTWMYVSIGAGALITILVLILSIK